MKIRFKAAGYLGEYDSLDLRLKDGQTADVDEARAKRLLASFPLNFSAVAEEPNVETRALDVPVNVKMIRRARKK